MIVGDSIAVGTQQHAPACELQGRGGINSSQFNRAYPDSFYAETVIISLGSNDHQYVKTYDELFEMRQRVGAARVFWVLPAGVARNSGVTIQQIQHTVQRIAAYYGDTVLPITRLQPDGIHPSAAGYTDIAEKSK